MKTKKIRLSVPLSEDIYNRLNEEAEKIGVSQASYAAYIIGQYYNQLELNLNATKEGFKTVLDTLFKNSNIDYKALYEKGIETGYRAMDDILSTQVKEVEDENK